MAFFAAACALSVFAYGALLLVAVREAAAATTAEREIHALTVSVATLESVYLAKTRSLTLEQAQELGFVPPERLFTVYAGEPTLTLKGR